MIRKPGCTQSLVRYTARLFALGFLGTALLGATNLAYAQQADANPARITQVIDETVLSRLKGNVHPLARPEFDRGPASASLSADRMQLVLKRSPRQEIALRQFLGSLQDPNSTQYRKWLTPEQFGAQYGVSDADIQTVSAWLASQGFHVNSVNKAHTTIEFSGSVGQLQTAFHTQIHNFEVNGETHLANVSDPQIPTALTPVVAGVSSLNNFFPKPQHTKPQLGKYDKETGKLAPELTIGSASGGYSLVLVPGDAATIYDTPNSFNVNFNGSASYTGTGVIIGIAGISDINPATFGNYRSTFGLPPLTPTVVVDGVDPGVTDGQIEAYLDLEVSGGLAPGANLNFYIAADTNLQSGLFLAIQRALNDNAVDILSVSFSGCEAFEGLVGNQLINNMWEQGAAQGITVTVAAGGSGSAGCDDSDAAQFGLQVNGLASTSFNIAVGGTDYDVLASDFTTYVGTTHNANYTSALGYIPEEPWNNSTSANGLLSANIPNDADGATNIVAGGGGASGCIDYQLATDPSGAPLPYDICEPVYGNATGWLKPSWQTGSNLNIPDSGARNLPDLSLMAGDGQYDAAWVVCSDFIDAMNIAHNCIPTSDGLFFVAEGGTSASAPAFAGMLALVAQSQGGSLGAVRLGQANYVLYNLANQPSLYGTVFHDITSGNNSVYCTAGSPDCGPNLFETGYNTNAGYDQASGLGSVDVTQLIHNWTKAAFTSTTTTLTINGATTPVSITHGQAVTLNATVAGPSPTPVPSGDIALIGNANEQASTSNSDGLGFFSLSNGTTGPVSYANLPGGSYTVSANYGGDINFAQSQSSGVQVTVAKENSVLNLLGVTGSSSFTPSGSYPYGTSFSLEAEPIGASQVGSTNPPLLGTGSIVFADTAGLPSGTSGTVAINSNGFAELPSNYWSTGAHSVSASYAGDNSFNASSSTVAFTITPAPTTSTVTSSVSSISSGTFTVTSSITPNPASGATLPTGTVTLTLSGSTIGSGAVSATTNSTTGAVVAATITVNASSLALGANTITAAYSGDTNYAASSGTVAVASTATPALAIFGTSIAAITAGGSGTSTITVTPGSSGFTGAVNLTCSVSPTTGTSVPTCAYNPASVTISGTAAATSTLTITTSSTTTAGSYTLTINAGDAATATLPFTVNAAVVAPGTFALTSTAATVSSPGESGSSSITVTPSNNYAGTVNLACALTTAPSGANATYNPTCTLSAASIKITSSEASSVTATFATTAPTSGALSYPQTNQKKNNRWYEAAGGAALASMLFFGIPARRRGWKSMLSLLVFLVAMAGVGCGAGGGGGGGGSSKPTLTTPTVTVTPASSSVVVNQPLSVKAVVSGSGATPTGTVSFSSGTYSSAAQALSAGAVTYVIPASSLTVGSTTIDASYSGDSNYNPASGSGAVTVTAAGTPGTTVGTYIFTITGTDSVTNTITASTVVTVTVN